MLSTTPPSSHPRVGVAVLIWRNNQILLIRRHGAHGEGTWSVPGGHLEYGETWEGAAARETMEEVGVLIKDIQFLALTNDIFESDGKHYVTIWLTSTWAANEASIVEPDKITSLGWHSLTDLPQPLFNPCWDNLRAVKPELFTT